ncbi:MAG: hypothetical protein M0Q94_02520 [Candidatus Cloacimonetes bacterium]|jgi:competence protein ComGC|nr:hypothetical protein [Candidatus Cloacimonadota bacterium]
MSIKKFSETVQNIVLSSSGIKKFSLIDLLMIIMIVGVILTIIIPIQQTRKIENIVKDSFSEMQKIIKANEEFKRGDWGDYAFDIDMLNLKDLDESVFKFSLNDTSIVAVTTEFGNEEKAYYYHLFDRRFRVRNDSKDVIFDAWLPTVTIE